MRVPCLKVDCHPYFEWILGADAMKPQGGQETYHSSRHSMTDFGKRSGFTWRRFAEAVHSSPGSLEYPSFVEPMQVNAWDLEGIQIGWAHEAMFSSQCENAFIIWLLVMNV